AVHARFRQIWSGARAGSGFGSSDNDPISATPARYNCLDSMPLAPGTRLGPYEILAPLGAGGMGEVYRVRDRWLGREVALKVLPASIAANQERRARFEYEARAASGLTHPNIAAIYDVGFENDLHYIAMELVPCQTLGELIRGRRLPLSEALNYAAQIADALSAAHDTNIVHRDLKPGNIMVTESGLVKLVDFGLAKATQRSASTETETTR